MNSIGRRGFLGGAAALLALPLLNVSAAEPGDETDYLGIWRTSRNYQNVKKAGVRVLNLPDQGTFCGYWVPPGATRVMVVIHGTNGNPYAELQDELPTAIRDGYAVLAPYWQASPTTYRSPAQVYSLIRVGLDFLAANYGTDQAGAAYCGFSRGGAIAYEIAHRDLIGGDRRLSLSIAHSGGIPEANPTPYLADLIAGKYGDTAFGGSRWVLYAGHNDAEWGEGMAVQINYASGVITRFGGTVDALYDIVDGTHHGYRENPAYHDASLALWASLRAEKVTQGHQFVQNARKIVGAA